MGRFEFTVVADLTANIFSACLVIFLVLANAAAERPARPEGALDAAEAFVLVERRPLPGADRVALLEARGGAAGIGLDLRADGVAASGEASERFALASDLPQRLGASLRRAAGRPVRLYVFDGASYAPVVTALRAQNLPFTEIAVPEALRDPSRPRTAWSQGFAALSAEARTPERFRQGLAQLLDAAAERKAGTPPPAAAAAGVPTAGSAPGTPLASLYERLRTALARLLAVGVSIAGLLAVILVERRHPRTALRG